MTRNPFVVKHDQDVLPALREMFDRRPHCIGFDARALSFVLFFRGYLPYAPSDAQVEAALEALDIEREGVA